MFISSAVLIGLGIFALIMILDTNNRVKNIEKKLEDKK